MSAEILSVAVFAPVDGQEQEALETVRELSAVLAKGGYSRDILYRGPEGEYVLVRYWKSDDARRAALEDPEAQRRWAKLAHEVRILKVHESLEEIPL
jgi:heme-degrading monooxygenase HmoA